MLILNRYIISILKNIVIKNNNYVEFTKYLNNIKNKSNKHITFRTLLINASDKTDKNPLLAETLFTGIKEGTNKENSYRLRDLENLKNIGGCENIIIEIIHSILNDDDDTKQNIQGSILKSIHTKKSQKFYYETNDIHKHLKDILNSKDNLHLYDFILTECFSLPNINNNPNEYPNKNYYFNINSDYNIHIGVKPKYNLTHIRFYINIFKIYDKY